MGREGLRGGELGTTRGDVGKSQRTTKNRWDDVGTTEAMPGMGCRGRVGQDTKQKEIQTVGAQVCAACCMKISCSKRKQGCSDIDEIKKKKDDLEDIRLMDENVTSLTTTFSHLGKSCVAPLDEQQQQRYRF